MLPTKFIILSGLFAAIMALLAQISIPIPFSPVPITGQMFGVFLAATILGGRWGAFSMLTYIFMGAIGLPVFSFAQGGIHMLLGPTGGYLWGFIPGSYLLGQFIEKRESYFSMLTGMFICIGVIHSLGALQLAVISGLNLRQTIMLGIIPFLPMDILKAVAAAGFSLAVRRRLLRMGLIQ
mgnify:CR=1 FL=1